MYVDLNGLLTVYLVDTAKAFPGTLRIQDAECELH